MALNTLKCNHLMPLPFKGLIHNFHRQPVFFPIYLTMDRCTVTQQCRTTR